MVEITYRDALRQALQDGMRADPKVVVMGEEVGLYGGAYGVTKGLIEEFGAERLLDTPISEPAIVGAAVGAAMTGLRPVAELMYVDFLGMTMDQLANQAAKIRYMFGGQIGVPIVLRTQGGTGRSAGAQHSQSLEAWVMHTPGLRQAPHRALDATGEFRTIGSSWADSTAAAFGTTGSRIWRRRLSYLREPTVETAGRSQLWA